jgi:hypothetical protein
MYCSYDEMVDVLRLGRSVTFHMGVQVSLAVQHSCYFVDKRIKSFRE